MKSANSREGWLKLEFITRYIDHGMVPPMIYVPLSSVKNSDPTFLSCHVILS